MTATIEIPVAPVNDAPRQLGELPTHSALYRADTQLSAVLDLALRSREDAEPSGP